MQTISLRLKALLFITIIFLTALNTIAQEIDTVFFEDFNGHDLNREVWNVRTTGFVFNNEQQAYVDSSATIRIIENAEGAKNGVLEIRAVYSPDFVTADGKTFDFLSGRINTKGKLDFTYGTAAARIKMTPGEGLWPAFWALGNGRWPETGEIDIMEYVGETDWTGVALHGPGYSGETPLVNKYFFDDEQDVTSWHIYSVDWTAESFDFRIDGRLIYRVTRPMVEHYGQWAFDSPKHLILNLAIGGGYPHKTNGIEEPYFGLPQETVDLIRNGESKILVDWVYVTKP